MSPNPTLTNRLSDAAVMELSSLRADLLASLPLTTVLQVRLGGTRMQWSVAGTETAPGSDFDAQECVTIANAVELGRAHADDVTQWAQRKAQDPSFRVTQEVALAGIYLRAAPRWQLSDVLRALDARIEQARVVELSPLSLAVAA